MIGQMTKFILYLTLLSAVLVSGCVSAKSTLQFVSVASVADGRVFILREDVTCTLEDYANTVGWDATFYFKPGMYREVASDQSGSYYRSEAMLKWVHGGVPFFVGGGIYVPSDASQPLHPWRVSRQTASFMAGNVLTSFPTGAGKDEVILDGPLSQNDSFKIRSQIIASMHKPNHERYVSPEHVEELQLNPSTGSGS